MVSRDLKRVSRSCDWSARQISVYVGTGWRRLTGSPKLQIILYKRATKYRSLLRKMTYKDKGSYESSPPCIDWDIKRICISKLRLQGSQNMDAIWMHVYTHRDISGIVSRSWDFRNDMKRMYSLIMRLPSSLETVYMYINMYYNISACWYMYIYIQIHAPIYIC